MQRVYAQEQHQIMMERLVSPIRITSNVLMDINLTLQVVNRNFVGTVTLDSKS